jgi:Tetratricopeptide repeat
MRAFVTAIGLCVSGLGIPFRVAAQDSMESALPSRNSEPQERTALRLGHDGLKLFEAQRFNEAHAQFAAAERLAHSPVFLLYMARCRYKTGKLLEARALLARVSAEPVPEDAPEAWRRAVSDARAEHSSLLERVPKVRIALEGGSGAIAVRVDGKVVSAADLERSLELDPGAHWVSARDADGHEVTRTFDLKERQGEARIELAIAQSAASKPEAGVSGGVARVERSSGPWRTVGFVLLGVGALGLGAGATAGIVAKNKTDEIEKNCIDGHCLVTDGDKQVDAKRWADASTIGFIAGGVVVAAGVVLVIVDPGAGPRNATGQASLTEGAALRLGLGSIAVRGRF